MTPEPVEYRHWEIYLASLFTKQPDTWTATAPHLEVNYVAISNLQLHAIFPMALNVPSEGASSYGYGDTELGVNYRFIQEGEWRRRSEPFHCWKYRPDRTTGTWVASSYRLSSRSGSRKASARGPLTVAAVTGSIPALTIKTGGLPGSLYSARLRPDSLPA